VIEPRQSETWLRGEAWSGAKRIVDRNASPGLPGFCAYMHRAGALLDQLLEQPRTEEGRSGQGVFNSSRKGQAQMEDSRHCNKESRAGKKQLPIGEVHSVIAWSAGVFEKPQHRFSCC